MKQYSSALLSTHKTSATTKCKIFSSTAQTLISIYFVIYVLLTYKLKNNNNFPQANGGKKSNFALLSTYFRLRISYAAFLALLNPTHARVNTVCKKLSNADHTEGKWRWSCIPFWFSHSKKRARGFWREVCHIFVHLSSPQLKFILSPFWITPTRKNFLRQDRP